MLFARQFPEAGHSSLCLQLHGLPLLLLVPFSSELVWILELALLTSSFVFVSEFGLSVSVFVILIGACEVCW